MAETANARWLTGWRLALLGTVAMAVYAAMVTVTLPDLQRMAGGRPMFDLRPAGYSLVEARTILETLGDEGRAVYRTRQLPLDAVYPGLLAATLIGLWSLATRSLGWTAPRWRRMAWLAVAMAALDYAENLTVLALLLRFPAVDGALVSLASAFTVTKSAAGAACFTGVLAVGGWAVWRRLRPPQPHPGTPAGQPPTGAA